MAKPRGPAPVGLLDGDLAGSIYQGFKGSLSRGIVRRTVVPTETALDPLGDPEAAVPQDTSIEGFAENYSRFSQAQIGIPATDLKLNIFAASAPGFTPVVGDRVRLDRRVGSTVVSQWYQIRGPVNIDPADVLWVCQSFEVAPPQ